MKNFILVFAFLLGISQLAFSQKGKSKKKSPVKKVVHVPVSNPVLTQDFFGRYEYIAGDPQTEFLIETANLSEMKFPQLTSSRDSVVITANQVTPDSVSTLNKTPVYVHQGCVDVTCKSIWVRIVKICDSTQVMICKNGYMRFVKDGKKGIKSTSMPIGGRQIFFCPPGKADLFLSKLKTLKEKPQL